MGNKCTSIEDPSLYEIDTSKLKEKKRNKSVVIKETRSKKSNLDKKSHNKSSDSFGDPEEDFSLPQ